MKLMKYITSANDPRDRVNVKDLYLVDHFTVTKERDLTKSLFEQALDKFVQKNNYQNLTQKLWEDTFNITIGFYQPERSKREDSQQCEMRCSEHCGNTVRDK